MPRSRKRPRRAPKRHSSSPVGPSSFGPFGFPPDFGFKHWSSPFETVPRDIVDTAVLQRSAEASQELVSVVAELDDNITKVPPLRMLADFGLYGLMARHGQDSEVADSEPVLQFHVELLQAFALRHDLHEFSSDDMLPEQFETLHRLTRTAARAFVERTLADRMNARDDPKDAARVALRDEIRIDTMVVRNWGYAPQVRRIVRDLLLPLEPAIERHVGIRMAPLFDAFDALARQRAQAIHDFRTRLQPIRRSKSISEALDAYRRLGTGVAYELAELEKGRQAGNWSLRDVKFFLMVQAINPVAASFYSFSAADLIAVHSQPADRERLSDVLQRLSLSFGDLKTVKPEHLFMANPVWRRPLVRVEDRYSCPIFGMLVSFPLEITEALVRDSDALVRAYEKRRADFLEDEAVRVLQSGFPQEQVFAKSQWRDPASGVLYENDAFVVVGRHVLVVEAKSGHLRSAARRGAPSMAEDLAELVVGAATQATRFARFLSAHPGEQTFTRRDGGTNHALIPRNAVAVTLSLTLDELGGLASSWPALQKAGIAPADIPAVPTMSIAAAQSVFELLPLAAQKLHYLQRRQEFEEHARYSGDELDLLAFYLYTGFNIGETEFQPDATALMLTGLSTILDPYFTREHFGVTKIEPVRQRLTPWWRDLISHVEQRRRDGWSRIAATLLNVSYEDQVAFENGFTTVRNIVKRRPQVAPGTMDRVVLANGPPQRRDALVALAYKDLPRDRRHRRLMAAGADGLEASGARFAIVLAVDVRKPVYPYNVLQVVADNETIAELV